MWDHYRKHIRISIWKVNGKKIICAAPPTHTHTDFLKGTGGLFFIQRPRLNALSSDLWFSCHTYNMLRWWWCNAGEICSDIHRLIEQNEAKPPTLSKTKHEVSANWKHTLKRCWGRQTRILSRSIISIWVFGYRYNDSILKELNLILKF